MATATVAVKVVDKRTPEQIAQDKAAQESVQETKTPEQLAAEALLKDQMVLVSGTSYQNLMTVTRYLNRNKIQARGENWFKKNTDVMVQAACETLIDARAKAIKDQLEKSEQADKDAAFRLLISKGIKVEDAYERIYKAN